MDESGAVGLDLSFATHVFLMEPLADASLQAQVESRAHRMGAVKPIHLEILAMQVSQYHKISKRYLRCSNIRMLAEQCLCPSAFQQEAQLKDDAAQNP